jgi:hypothetical protein
MKNMETKGNKKRKTSCKSDDIEIISSDKKRFTLSLSVLKEKSKYFRSLEDLTNVCSNDIITLPFKGEDLEIVFSCLTDVLTLSTKEEETFRIYKILDYLQADDILYEYANHISEYFSKDCIDPVNIIGISGLKYFDIMEETIKKGVIRYCRRMSISKCSDFYVMVNIIEKLSDEKYALKDKNNILEEEIDEERERISELEDNYTTLEIEKDELEAEKDDLEERISSLEEEIQSLRAENDDLREELE